MATSPPCFVLDRKAVLLRNLPSNTFLIHATNCLGEWGAGIALELRGIFPGAYRQCRAHCDSFRNQRAAGQASLYPPREGLAGTCHIISPQESDVAAGAPRVFIVCVFTSYGFGRANPAKGKPGLDRPARVLDQTASSLHDFREQLAQLAPPPHESEIRRTSDAEWSEGGRGIAVYSPMFNSGAFKVPWEKTQHLIEQQFAGWQGQWTVLEPPPPSAR